MPETAQHEVQTLIDDLYTKHLATDRGEVATYIPELSKVDPGLFGMCVVTADGRVFEAGDCDHPFTIQSISKPFTFGMAMDEFGADNVMQHVGVEPSGDAFNAIELHSPTNRPLQPDDQQPARSTVTALLHARHGRPHVRSHAGHLQCHRRAATVVRRGGLRVGGRTGHRNRAIAHLLLNFGVVHEEAEARSTSISSSARSW